MARCSMVPEPCPVLSARQLTERETHLVVGAPGGFDPLPGQFVMVSVPGIGEAPSPSPRCPGRERRRAASSCASGASAG